MESAAANTKKEDTAHIAATTAMTTTDAVTDETGPLIKLDKVMVMTTDDVEYAVVSELAVVPNETAININTNSNNPKFEEDQLNIAMASTTISTNEVDEIKHNLGETVLNEQQKPLTAMVEKEIVISENSDINLDISIKSKSEYHDINNSTIGSGFEDAVEYIINDEEDSIIKEQLQDVIQQENVNDDESCSQQEEGGEGEDDYGDEINDVSNNLN